MQNIIIYLIKGSIIFSLLLFSCKKEQHEKIYYYSVITKSDTIPRTFFATVISEKDGIRKTIEYRYSLYANAIVDTSVNYYKLSDDGLYKLRNRNNNNEEEYFLSIKDDTCIVYNHSDPILNDVLSTKHCFIGKETIMSGQDSDSIETYVFIKKVGLGEGVTTKVYYDKSFLLVKQEYIKGYSPEFNRYLTKDIPEGFALLLSCKFK